MNSSKSPLKKYTDLLIFFGLGLAVVSAICGYTLGEERVHKLWFLLLLFIVAIQYLVVAYTVKFAQHETKTLLRQYQVARYAKLFIYMIMLAVCVWAVKLSNPVAFLINFIIYYLIFTVLETVFFHKWMNKLPRTIDKFKKETE